MTETSGTMAGGCLCGAVRYVITGAPRFISQCCCKDCQKATGTGHTTIVGILREQLAGMQWDRGGSRFVSGAGCRVRPLSGAVGT